LGKPLRGFNLVSMCIANNALGLRLRYDRDGDYSFVGAQLNRLVKRWNKPDSQANIYAHAALGTVIDDSSGPLTREDDLGLFIGASGDWETRKYFFTVGLWWKGATDHSAIIS